MSSRRTLILIGAIAIGAFAAFALLNYVRGIEDDVYADAQPVPVLVATQDIPAGTTSADALATMIEATEVPQDIRPATFVSPESLDQIAGLVARADIPANQIIVQGLFVDPSVAVLRFADQVPSGQVAISVNIDQVRAVGGYLQPGDEVNMMVLHENTTCGTGGGGGGGEQEAPEIGPGGGLSNEIYCTFTQPARYLFQRVEILAIGDRQQLSAVQTEGGEQTPVAPQGGTITFMVPNDAAQLIASVNPDDIYLTLLPEDYEAETLPALTAETIDGPTPAERPEALTPYGPDGFVEGDAIAEVGASSPEEGGQAGEGGEGAPEGEG